MSKAALDNLADRVAELEQKVSTLLRAQHKAARTKDWRRTVGMFAGDEVMKEIFRLGQEIREADRRANRGSVQAPLAW